MKRDDVLKLMREVYAARVKGDVDLLMKYTTDDMQFRLNASPEQRPVAFTESGADGTRKALQMLVASFEFLACDIVDAVVEGERAAIRVKIRARARATGTTSDTESLDFVEFRDGKLAAYTQFFDTAAVERMMMRG